MQAQIKGKSSFDHPYSGLLQQPDQMLSQDTTAKNNRSVSICGNLFFFVHADDESVDLHAPVDMNGCNLTTSVAVECPNLCRRRSSCNRF